MTEQLSESREEVVVVKGSDEGIKVPRWAAGVLSTVVAAVIMGAVTQSVLLYAQIQVTNERLELMVEKVKKIEDKLDRDHVSSRQIDALQRRLDRLEDTMRDLRRSK